MKKILATAVLCLLALAGFALPIIQYNPATTNMGATFTNTLRAIVGPITNGLGAGGGITNNQTGVTLGGAFTGDGVGLTNANTTAFGRVLPFRLSTRCVFSGDSLTAGTALVPFSYVVFFTNYFLPYDNVTLLTNVGYGGRTASNALAFYNSEVHPWAPSGGTNGLLCFWAGWNDINNLGYGVTASYGFISNYWRLAKQDGFTLVAFTIPYSTYLIGNGHEPERQELNRMIRSSASRYDYLVDVDALIPNPDYDKDPTEHIHYMTNGCIAIAAELSRVLSGGAAAPAMSGPFVLDGANIKTNTIGTNAINGFFLDYLAGLGDAPGTNILAAGTNMTSYVVIGGGYQSNFVAAEVGLQTVTNVASGVTNSLASTNLVNTTSNALHFGSFPLASYNTNSFILVGSGSNILNGLWTWTGSRYTNATPALGAYNDAGYWYVTNDAMLLYTADADFPLLWTDGGSSISPLPAGRFAVAAANSTQVRSNAAYLPYLVTGTNNGLLVFGETHGAVIGGLANFDLGTNSAIVGGRDNVNEGTQSGIFGSQASHIAKTSQNAMIAGSDQCELKGTGVGIISSAGCTNFATYSTIFGSQWSSMGMFQSGVQNSSLINGYMSRVDAMDSTVIGLWSETIANNGYSLGNYNTNTADSSVTVGHHLASPTANSYSFGNRTNTLICSNGVVATVGWLKPQGGITTNVLAGTNTLCFTNGILMKVQ